MRILQICLALMLTLGAFSAARAACEYPPDVQLPNGATASKDDMTAARTAVETYMKAMEAYRDCLDAETAGLAEEARTAEQKTLHAKRHNAAVDAMESVAARFNEQVRAFKAANK